MTKHNTAIEWTHIPGYKGETWNPVVGCKVVSPGCTNCYAMRMAGNRLDGNPNTPHYASTTQPSKAGPVWTGKIGEASDKAFNAPLRWTKPRAIFVNSMGDLFAENVTDEQIARVFQIAGQCPQHIFIILTKRAKRMREWIKNHGHKAYNSHRLESSIYPAANVWLGVSVEDQARADERIPHLLATPAAKRFLSCEPLLGAIDLDNLSVNTIDTNGTEQWSALCKREAQHALKEGGIGTCLDWIIVGGESGPNARPMHPDWARNLRDQCASARVPFFFKQWGEWLPATEDAQHPFWNFQDGSTIDGHALPDFDDPQTQKTWRDGLDRIDDDTEHAIFLRTGKKKAGHKLDGETHHNWPIT